MSLPVFVKRHWYLLAASALIVCGVASRLTLILLGWPHGNSEEGTMGLEALHILTLGARPIYLYGQNYMGVGEAYAGALAYRLFGVSTVSLRLGMVAFYALFLLGVFWLAHQLYPRRVALASLVALILGTPFLVKIELLADGGKAETMALGALMFALVTWLALNPPTARTPRRQRALRAAAFFAWGVMAGFGLYTYTIIAPFVLTTGLLLWLTCRRELLGPALALPLVGLLIGLSPDFVYTATMPLADNPIAVFWSLHQSLNSSGASGVRLLPRQVDATLLYTLPIVTGLTELYPVEALPRYGPIGPWTLVAVFIGGGWSVCYLTLLALATWRPLLALRQRWTRWTRWTRWLPGAWRSAAQRERDKRRMAQRGDVALEAEAGPVTAPSPARARRDAQHLARLLLALTGWLTIAAYTLSATAANNPHSGRYMIGLLVIAPAVLWPLLEPAPQLAGAARSLRASLARLRVASARQTGEAILRAVWRPVVVTLLAVWLIVGAGAVARTIPSEAAADARDVQFTHDLLSRGITRFYSDYWTCDLIGFDSHEHIVCTVISDYGQPGYTRYHPYTVAVQADPTAPYVLIPGSEIERTFLAHATQVGQRYTVTSLDGRNIYTPIGP